MKQERIEEADFDGLSRFIKFQELASQMCACAFAMIVVIAGESYLAILVLHSGRKNS